MFVFICVKMEAKKPIARCGLASKGKKIQLLTNHYKVNVKNVDGHFFQYTVAFFYEDGRPVEGKGIKTQVLDCVHDTYKAEVEGKDFAYDGEKSLFTVGALPKNKLEFTVVLKDNSSNRNNQSKSYKVEISFAAKIPMQAIAQALRGQDSKNSQEAIRVLNIIVRQHAAKQGCRFERQLCFNVNEFSDLGGGVLGYHGFNSSFRTTQGGLSLNIDSIMVIKPGPVVDFLIANQNAKDSFSLDWATANQVLKGLRVKTSSTNTAYKITGLSDEICKKLMFSMKRRGEKDENGEPLMTELSVYDYFVNIRNIPLCYSGDLPCIIVGNPKRPTYIPLELCSLVSLQHYPKALTTLQPGSLVEKSKQKPQDRMTTLTNGPQINNYADEPLLRACGVSIINKFTEVDGRMLAAPRIRVGHLETIAPHNGRWNFSEKKLLQPTTISEWAVVNFSAKCNMQSLINDLIKCGELKGMNFLSSPVVIEESPQHRRDSPLVRVEKMFKFLFSKLPYAPQFLLCVLPERKSPLYGHWKRNCQVVHGIYTQCIGPKIYTRKGLSYVVDQRLMSVLLKINAKLGGLNSKFAIGYARSISQKLKAGSLIIGMTLCRGSSDVPSIAAVVSSGEGPLSAKYRASVHTQSPKVKMIASLFTRVADNKDDGIMSEILDDYYMRSGSRRPEQIIIFRNGVSESQFNQVLNFELNQIIEACKFKDGKWCPKFVVIIAQKSRHTKFFQPTSADNVPAGTVVDNKICHPRNNDFYLCAQAGMVGTTRPTHYHVLLDEIGFSPDEMQKFVHFLCYQYQGSTTATSVVAPIHYARLAATQTRKFTMYDDTSETCSNHGGGTVHEKLRNSMFFV
ncbi:hypothetical protein DCAR_0833143 [Daucus carota subsp. sativus]|uniref:Piwi domain-containing protein n=2 Tax=Daucus carota subsp. sativus TaxID=79200 RepID=A0AAF0XSX9_DAUCS|nr:hypothetical protein DCAR_0833137 [Daucus carota subsp. sativus]WOH13633.1 hypothetical protein DCAR_0833143 [Daucus carota subsp. sativus]